MKDEASIGSKLRETANEDAEHEKLDIFAARRRGAVKPGLY